MRMKRNRKLNVSRRKTIDGYIFILPWLIGLLIYGVYPFFNSIRLSVSELTDIVGFKMKYVGWENYAKAFIWDIKFVPLLLKAIRATLINTPVVIIASLFFAILLNRRMKFRGFFRAVFFLPVLIGSGYIMAELLGMRVNNSTMAVDTDVIRGIRIPTEFSIYLGQGLMNILEQFFNQFTLILWKTGVQILLFLGALQSVPPSLYESAHCDGASQWEMFWKITLPMISPMILLATVYTFIDSFTDSVNPVINYMRSLKGVQLSYGTALAWIYFVFIFILVMIVYLVLKRIAYDVQKT